MAVLTAVEHLGKFKLSDVDAALLCQRAENDFVGVKCGIMDMLISRKGMRDHALFVNCSDLSSRAVKIDLPGYSWLVADSGKRRGLVESEYNTRRSECEEALKLARIEFPNRRIVNLRDLAIADFAPLSRVLPKTIYRRLRHVVSENARVLDMLRAVESRDVTTVGRLLFASHESLRDDFGVSCPELDDLVEIASRVQGICGARLPGAGFGGSIIVLARTASAADLKWTITEEYARGGSFDSKASVFPVRISDGARVLPIGR
jgi:galactokinase